MTVYFLETKKFILRFPEGSYKNGYHFLNRMLKNFKKSVILEKLKFFC